jgi:hypothetical protein
MNSLNNKNKDQYLQARKNNINNEWQVIRNSTRKRNHPTQNDIPENKIETNNRYSILANETNLKFTEFYI